MNIFLLDKNIRKCARYHCDQHVIKMILESTQILSTVLHSNGMQTPYRPSHQKHPCVIWTGQSLQNWLWLRELVFQLNDEYKYRYNSLVNHKSYEIAKKLEVPSLPILGLLEHPQIMPEEYKVPRNPIKAYRNFYIFNKSRFATWRKRKAPEWYKSELIEHG
jgi:hypothetical protein